MTKKKPDFLRDLDTAIMDELTGGGIKGNAAGLVGTLTQIKEIKQLPIEEMDEDTKVSLAFDKEKLYKNMVDAKADWLYNLPAWDEIFDAETKHALYLEQKKSGTVVVGKKIGRNDPCPCGSGKKYKKCCGKNA